MILLDTYHSIRDSLFYVNMVLAGLAAVWLAVVLTRRWAARDPLAGDVLALGTLIVFIGLSVSAGYRVVQSIGITTTPLTPVVTVGLFIVAIVAPAVALHRHHDLYLTRERKREAEAD